MYSIADKIFSKFFTFLIFLKYPKVPSQYRWFLRFYYSAKSRQFLYFMKDYIIKKPYKEVTFQGEFQQELINALPFAYWHYKNGTLLKTYAAKYTNPLYFFSNEHYEKYGERDWQCNFNTDIPNAPHNLKLDTSKWLPPPLKEHYKNEKFIYDKPMLVIANRYNSEWSSEEPISYFDLSDIIFMIDTLSDKYQIVYNRPLSTHIVNDNSEVKDLNELSVIREKYPQVIILTDLYNTYKNDVVNFNELQLMIYANAENFISVHGGTATFASYFGGKNIIYSKRGLEHEMKEYQNIFPKLSGAEIFHAKNKHELICLVRSIS